MTTATAQQIVTRASNELGIAASSLETGLITQTGTQALAMLNSLGDDLLNLNDWQFLEGTATINGDGSTSSFDLPDDFGRIVNQTLWSSNMMMPGYGPLTAQQWGWIQFGIVSTGIYFKYRILNDKLEVYPTPSSTDVLNFYYIKKNWVINYSSGGMQDLITNAADSPIFDRLLMIKGLKARLWGQKGFDTTELAKDFEDELSIYQAQTAAAPVLRLSGDRDGFLIDPFRNIKDGNW